MKHLKKFEDIDNIKVNYYSCDECDCLFDNPEIDLKCCPSCESIEIEELQKEEWDEIKKSRIND